MVSEDGFLLSYLKYGDNDAILHLFLRDKGYRSYMVKGIYSPKSKKKAYLFPLNELSLLGPPQKHGTLERITKLESVDSIDLHGDFRLNAIVFFIADFLNQILRDEGSSGYFYDEIKAFLQQVKIKNYRAHFIFLVKVLKVQGLVPLVGIGEYLDPEKGTFSHEQSHQLFDLDTSLLWRSLISSEKPYETEIKSTIRKNLMESILLYYHIHLPNFYTPRSLEILQQIFQ